MKSKELEALKGKTANELVDELEAKKKELFNLRFQLATGQLQNTSAVSACRHDIARVKTVIRQRQEQEKGKGVATSNG